MRLLSLIALLAVTGLAQPAVTSRTFTFAHTQDQRHIQEMFNMIRGIAEVKDASVDPAQRTMTVAGNPDQLTLITWLFTELDRPASRPQSLQVRDNTFNDPSAPSVKIFYPANLATAQQVQEVINGVRSIAEVQRCMALSGPGAVVIRATSEQAALAEWIVAELDRSMSGKRPAGKREYSYPDTLYPPDRRATAVRIYYPAAVATPVDIQEMVNGIRSVADAQRVVAFSATGAIIQRTAPAQADLTDWLVKELDQASTGVREYRYAEGTVRATVLPKGADLSSTVAKLRESTGMRRVVALSRQRTIVMRGTAEQLAAAEPLLR
jgi:type II secretory pathway component GspD/PulD (secretin)